MSYCWRIRQRVLRVASGYKKILWGSSRVSLCWCNGWVHFPLRNVFELETDGEILREIQCAKQSGETCSTVSIDPGRLFPSTPPISFLDGNGLTSRKRDRVQGDFELFLLRAWRPWESSRIHRCTRTPDLLIHPLRCQSYLHRVALPVIPHSWLRPNGKTLNDARMVRPACIHSRAPLQHQVGRSSTKGEMSSRVVC